MSLRRGGQVFYLHNNVETISSCAAKIQEAVPEAKIAIGHGKMKEGELSEVWRQMLEQEIDVLVCTTIIETGVDLPNANTLIIENADCMGLSQLHHQRPCGQKFTKGICLLYFQTEQGSHGDSAEKACRNQGIYRIWQRLPHCNA